MREVTGAAVRLNDEELAEKQAAMIRQYAIKPSHFPKDNTTLRFKDQQNWLRAHGKIPAHDLTATQRNEIRECFTLIDADGSGTLDVDELTIAFKILSIPSSRSDIMRLFATYSDGGDEVDLKAFEKIMTASNSEHSGETDDDDARGTKHRNALRKLLGGSSGVVPLPFSQCASAFQRKRLLGLFMEGGAARQEILDSVEKQKRTSASDLFRKPTLRSRMTMTDVKGEKIVSRNFMLDKLEEMGEETWKGEREELPSQAIHKALRRNHTWDKAQQNVTFAIKAGKDPSKEAVSPGAGNNMNMYKMSAEDRKYAKERVAAEAEAAKEVKAEAAAVGDSELPIVGASASASAAGSGSEEESRRALGAFSPVHSFGASPSSIPKLPALSKESSLGAVSSTSIVSGGRKPKHGGRRANGFVPSARRKRDRVGGSTAAVATTTATDLGDKAYRAQVELAKSRKTKEVGEARKKKERRLGHGRGAIARVPSGVLHGLAQPGGRYGGGQEEDCIMKEKKRGR